MSTRRRPASSNLVNDRRRARPQASQQLPSIADQLPAAVMQNIIANGPNRPLDPITTLPSILLPSIALPSVPLQQEDTNEDDDQACVVCTEHVENIELACRHVVHLACIARSGQNVCPACRSVVQFDAENQALYEQQRQSNEQERIQREQNESLALARQLANQRENVHYQDNIITVDINRRMYRVTLRDIAPGAIDANDLMLQVNQVLHHINSNARSFEADERALELATLVVKMNRISATTNLSIAQLVSIIENNCM